MTMSFRPLKLLTDTRLVQYLRNTLPGMKAILAPPISAEDLALVTIHAALGKLQGIKENRVVEVEELDYIVKNTNF
jgi:hypothetical protein